MLEVIVDETFNLGLSDELPQDDLNRNKVWMFQLARRLATQFNHGERKGMGAVLAPLALVFVEVLAERIELPSPCDLNWNDSEDVQAAFVTAWYKVRFGEGEDLVRRAYEDAKREPCVLEMNKLGRVISTGYYLQQMNGGKSFFLPISEEVAAVFDMSKVTLSHYVTSAIEQGFFVETKPYVPKSRAREFRFNTRHPDLLTAFKS